MYVIPTKWIELGPWLQLHTLLPTTIFLNEQSTFTYDNNGINGPLNYHIDFTRFLIQIYSMQTYLGLHIFGLGKKC